jgi:hypothetical protein
MLNRKPKAKPLTPYEIIEGAIDSLSHVEEINGYTLEQSLEGKEMVYHLDIYFRGIEEATRITIPVLTACQLSKREMTLRLMATLGWRKEDG